MLHALSTYAHTSVRQLEKAIREFMAVTNEEPKPFQWTKTADEILTKVARAAVATHRIHTVS